MDKALLEWLQEQDVENTTLAKLLTKYYYTWQKYGRIYEYKKSALSELLYSFGAFKEDPKLWHLRELFSECMRPDLEIVISNTSKVGACMFMKSHLKRVVIDSSCVKMTRMINGGFQDAIIDEVVIEAPIEWLSFMHFGRATINKLYLPGTIECLQDAGCSFTINELFYPKTAEGLRAVQQYGHEVTDLLSRGTKIRCSDCTLEGDK